MITRVKKRSTMFVKFSSYRFLVSAYSQVSDCWRKSIDSGNDSFTLFWKQLEHNNSFSYYCLLFVNFWTTRTKPLFYNTFMPLWRCVACVSSKGTEGGKGCEEIDWPLPWKWGLWQGWVWAWHSLPGVEDQVTEGEPLDPRQFKSHCCLVPKSCLTLLPHGL